MRKDIEAYFLGGVSKWRAKDGWVVDANGQDDGGWQGLGGWKVSVSYFEDHIHPVTYGIFTWDINRMNVNIYTYLQL